ncbi:MAG: hypothetical protein U0Q15_19625 [Kineosporiaceae bacterium]
MSWRRPARGGAPGTTPSSTRRSSSAACSRASAGTRSGCWQIQRSDSATACSGASRRVRERTAA